MDVSSLNRKIKSLNFSLVDNYEDMDSILEMAYQAHMESRFLYISFSREKVLRLADLAIKSPNSKAIFIAKRDTRSLAFSYCSLGEYHIGIGQVVDTIHNINTSASVRNSLSGGLAALGLFSRLLKNSSRDRRGA